MSVGATHFYLVLLAYILLLLSPLVIIKTLSENIGKIKTKFEIISGFILYPIIIVFGHYTADKIDNNFGQGLLNLYIGFALASIISAFILWLVKKSLTKRSS